MNLVNTDVSVQESLQNIVLIEFVHVCQMVSSFVAECEFGGGGQSRNSP